MTQTKSTSGRRAPLSREAVIRAAVRLADRDGFEALSMRKLGLELGVEAMAIYRHIGSKNELLDELAEFIVGQMKTASPSEAWKMALRTQVMGARHVMLRHPWARDVLEARGVAGPRRLAYIESVLAILRAGGFSVDLAHHALHVLDSRIFGFNHDFFSTAASIAAAEEPADEPDPISAGLMAARLPHITEMAQQVSHDGTLGACDDDVEFAFGLDLTLDGLERQRAED
jgi:AcrR family transcriptional regulator